MSSLEIIHLRSSGESVDFINKCIAESLNPADSAEEVVTIYQRKNLKTDISVHILHHTKQVPQLPSNLGIRLAFELKSYGLVEHTVWEEI